MIFAEFRELHTDRLCLRKLTREDIPLYFTRLGGSEAVTEYMLFDAHTHISQSVASVEKALRRYVEGRCYRFCIALAETDELIGVIEALRFDEARSSCSFAYMLGQAFWGHGYGTEALNALLDFLFTSMDIRVVEADHMAENAASGAVMRKAGMVRTGVSPDKYEKHGILHDAVQYAITREQWISR